MGDNDARDLAQHLIRLGFKLRQERRKGSVVKDDTEILSAGLAFWFELRHARIGAFLHWLQHTVSPKASLAKCLTVKERDAVVKRLAAGRPLLTGEPLTQARQALKLDNYKSVELLKQQDRVENARAQQLQAQENRVRELRRRKEVLLVQLSHATERREQARKDAEGRVSDLRNAQADLEEKKRTVIRALRASDHAVGELTFHFNEAAKAFVWQQLMHSSTDVAALRASRSVVQSTASKIQLALDSDIVTKPTQSSRTDVEKLYQSKYSLIIARLERATLLAQLEHTASSEQGDTTDGFMDIAQQIEQDKRVLSELIKEVSLMCKEFSRLWPRQFQLDAVCAAVEELEKLKAMARTTFKLNEARYAALEAVSRTIESELEALSTISDALELVTHGKAQVSATYGPPADQAPPEPSGEVTSPARSLVSSPVCLSRGTPTSTFASPKPSEGSGARCGESSQLVAFTVGRLEADLASLSKEVEQLTSTRGDVVVSMLELEQGVAKVQGDLMLLVERRAKLAATDPEASRRVLHAGELAPRNNGCAA